ncbi:MAG: hypothetical protein KAW41_02800 [Candidatus Diapherotrites archaeon]|nr:hypothetical protein [Candidatus Diapherotrites archaeon]
MKRIYLDTNVYLSKYRDEFYSGSVPAYARYNSEQILERTLACEFFVFSSDLVWREITSKFSYLEESFLSDMDALKEKNKMRMLESAPYLNKARMLNNKFGRTLGWKDCAHLLMSRDANATFISWEGKLVGAGKKIGLEVFRPDAL